MNIKKQILILLAVFFLAAFLRFYNFDARVTFWTEQARSLITSSAYFDKFSLLGQEYFRADRSGHVLFSGAVFNYSLIPLILLLRGNPIFITGFFGILNLATGLAVYIIAGKIFDKKVAIVSAVLFLFNSLMIYHSLFIWNYNYLPLVGLLVFYFSYKRKLFWAGLFSGIGISLQFLFAPIALAALVYCLWGNKKLFLGIFTFLIGAGLGNLPMVIFDLRHSFYHAKTLIQYFADTIAGNSDASVSYYYFLPFWPVLSIGGGWVINKLSRYGFYVQLLIIGIYLYLNLNSNLINFRQPSGMPVGINVTEIDSAAKLIAQDANGEFNVASVLDFDKRAYYLRYLITYRYEKMPLGIADYPVSKTIYVLGPENFDFEESSIWEIKSGGKYDIKFLANAGSGYTIYKLIQ